ncbi:phosphonate C-P lyase system protein PhnH [Oceanobacillus alkalisoli]|uniref:phosphonate C-P lyase system protein PhnH n=1 Tax=Oceanobacillus alkalisoli TaxID=2925113 RepID=UPI001EE48F96|nr:phosphonate C-P lyase system protein PhnH [Oceanobacillus alkalisoli]MCG5103305.1 phosphonate C-P lyase system protein PhnH [Oceanobacillus alkalisoli]
MAIDEVHDLQFVFREILHTMSRPGEIQSLRKLEGKNDLDLPLHDATLFTLLTLFDAEVSFHVLPRAEKQVAGKISAYTLASHTTLAKADFIIVLPDATEAEITEALEICKKGTLIAPHRAATFIIDTDFTERNITVRLTGPGIKEQTMLHTLSNNIWEARNTTVTEFPLGVDLILTDSNMQLVCVPRTTNVEVMEVE